ncbi:hypothetical protein DWX95_10895 [Butyricicoccus sp. AF22-28AC]|nr:hypothetical protein DWX95_10895 [Butyricicoccus sp. AF22-28AC]
MGTHCAPLRQKKSSAVLLLEAVAGLCLRRVKKQRETGVKRVETAGVYPFAPMAWVRRPQRAAKFVMILCFRLCLFRNSVILIAFVKYRKGSIVI